MPQLLSAPIPGESLTRTPKNAPYEQAPKYTTPDEALMAYIKKYNEPDVMDDLLYVIEEGYPIRAFVEGATTSAVMKGMHTVDVSVIIAPLLHEYIKSLASAAGIKYNEGFYTSEAKAKKEKERFQAILRKKIEAMAKTKPDAGVTEMQDILSAKPQEAAPIEEPMMPEEAPAPVAPRGLMARKTK